MCSATGSARPLDARCAFRGGPKAHGLFTASGVGAPCCYNEPMEQRKFDTFIFDLDGTLLDTVPDLTLLTNRILRDVGAPEHTQEEILSYVGAGVRRLIYLALPANASEETREEAMALWNEHFMEYYEHTVPFPGVVELLAQLRERGIGLGVVSNKLQPGVDVIMNRLLPGMVDVMFGESGLIPRKPDPKGIQTAMKFLKTAAPDTIYIGDSPGDVKAGRNAGTATAAVLWGYHKKEDFKAEDAEPDFYVENPLDLLAFAK